jgi:hypothetical protein
MKVQSNLGFFAQMEVRSVLDVLARMGVLCSQSMGLFLNIPDYLLAYFPRAPFPAQFQFELVSLFVNLLIGLVV